MKIKFYYTIVVASLVFTCFGQDNSQNSVTFIQNGNSQIINKATDSIILERKPFSIRYFCKQYDEKNEKFYAAQIAVVEKPSDLLFLKIGKKTEKIPYLEPGSGMAIDESGFYSTIFISNEGHHYLTYENEKEKRVNLISKNKDKLELEWEISGAFYDEKDISFSELKISTLYFVVFIDNNLNQIIDLGEIKVINVTFR